MARQIAANVEDWMYNTITDIEKRENRSKSNVIETLLKEALKGRGFENETNKTS